MTDGSSDVWGGDTSKTIESVREVSLASSVSGRSSGGGRIGGGIISAEASRSMGSVCSIREICRWMMIDRLVGGEVGSVRRRRGRSGI